MKPRPVPIAVPLLGAVVLSLAGLSACASSTSPSSPPDSSPPAAVQKALLAVSFGTSYDNNRDLSIGGIEQALAAAYSDYDVRRAFTAQTIVDILAERGTVIDNVVEAMDRLVADGVKDVVIQPTTIMSGLEYDDVVAEITPYKDKFDSFVMGAPLLTTPADFLAVEAAITAGTARYAADDTAVVFMGHGTHAPSNADYAQMQELLTRDGFSNYFVGTVEAEPTIEDVIAAAQAGGYTKAVLLPFMVVAGDHATNDMAGDEPDSWKSQFAKAGFEVECVLEGLGQNPDIQKIYVAHARAAMDEAQGLTATAAASTPAGSPISATQLREGTYPIDVATDSVMFKVVDAQLTAQSGDLTVVVTLSGDGFGRLFPGTADAAGRATTGFIDFTTDSENRHVYSLDIEALDVPVDIAAESGKTADKWYDHTMTFESGRIPAAAIAA
jgi:sirohydrochlorin cobaltochelatase